MSRNSLFLVSLVVDDYDRAKTFYRDGLGFDCVEDTVQPDGKRWLVVRPSGGEGRPSCSQKRPDDAQRARDRQPDRRPRRFFSSKPMISPVTISAS